MQEFDSLLKKSTSSISENYFQLTVFGKEQPIFRERVYCYELYHQLRCRWEEIDSNFQICGEIDKRGHPILRERKETPDFLVHVPGEDANFTIMEVKHSEFTKDGLIKDINTVYNFMNCDVPYERGICLIYGNRDGLIDDITTAVLEAEVDTSQIEIWHHPLVGSEASHIAIERTKPIAKTRV